MAVGVKYSTSNNQPSSEKTYKTDIKGQELSSTDTNNGLRYLLGIGYIGNEVHPYLVSNKGIVATEDGELPSDLATKEWVTDKIDEAVIGGEVDLSSYAKQSWVRDQNYATNANLNAEKITITASTMGEPGQSDIQTIKRGGTIIAQVPFTNSSGQTYSKEYYATSDKSMKENISSVNVGNDIFNVPIVEFNWKDTKAKSVGVIAQDLEKVAPVAVSTSDNGIKSVNYTTFLLLRIAALEDKINKLEDKINKMTE